MADMEDAQGNRTEQLYKLMKKAQLIRVFPENGVFQIISKITSEQKRSILDFLTTNSSVEIEFGVNTSSIRYSEDEYYDLEERLESLT